MCERGILVIGMSRTLFLCVDWPAMLDVDPRKMSAGSAAIAAADVINAPKHSAALSPAAVQVASQPIPTAYSPIVLAGTVRLIELLLIMLVGAAIYVGYVVPIDGFEWLYVGAITSIGVLAMLAFQAADIYQVQAFRGYEKQYFRLASAWSVVFLIAIGATFFAKIGDQFSRIWLGSFYVLGLLTLIGFRRALFLMVRHWTRTGRLDRRTVVVGADANGAPLSKRWLHNVTATCTSSAY